MSVLVGRANQTGWKEIYTSNISDITWALNNYSLSGTISKSSNIKSILIIISHAYPYKQLHHENASNIDPVDCIRNIDPSDLNSCQSQK